METNKKSDVSLSSDAEMQTSTAPTRSSLTLVHLILVGIISAALFGALGYYLGYSQQTNKDIARVAAIPTNYPTPTTLPTPTMVYPPLDKAAEIASISASISVPGWEKNVSDGSVHFRKMVNGTTYIVSFQFQEYFIPQNLMPVKKTQTQNGTTIYIARDNADKGNGVVSSCEPNPVGSAGCLLMYKGNPLDISLYPYHAGDQAVEAMDFTTTEGQEILKDFIKIVESARF